MKQELEKDMTPKLLGETWRKYPTSKSRRLSTFGKFECQYCGKEFETMVRNVKCGDTKSCGCYQKAIKKTHGLESNKFYSTWSNMCHRCNNPTNGSYEHYGARGIKVCEEWLDIRNFVAWAEATHPEEGGYTLDRIDNDKGYSPENCRWANRTTQALNQRMMRNNKSGYVGVLWHKRTSKWVASIGINNKVKHLGQFPTIEEAVLARDNYIIDNGLPHKLSTDYKKESL